MSLSKKFYIKSKLHKGRFEEALELSKEEGLDVPQVTKIIGDDDYATVYFIGEKKSIVGVYCMLNNITLGEYYDDKHNRIVPYNGSKLGEQMTLQKFSGGGRIESAYDNGATGSQSLKEKAQKKIDKGLTVIHFGYTDYGGTFMDKVGIAYFKKNYPKNILSEKSGYNGENAFVFGEVADKYLEENSDYPLGFEDIEDFYYQMESEQERKEYTSFLKELKSKYKVSPKAIEWLMENKSGYYQMDANNLDFNYEQLIKELTKEGLISPKKMNNGGGVGVSSEIDSDNNEIGTGADLNTDQYGKGGSTPSGFNYTIGGL